MSLDLQSAIIAANSGMWSIVIDCLQNIPLNPEIGEAPTNWLERQERILDLSLQVILQGDFEEQWAIAKILPKLGEMAVEPLLNIVNDSDIDLEDRWFVARILGDFKQPEVAIALVAVLQREEDADLSAMITGALAQIGTPAIAALTRLLDTPNRHQAIAALAQIRHSQTIEPLLRAIDDGDPQIRTTIIEALGSFHDPIVLPILLGKLTDVVADVRKATVTALSLRGESAVELGLIEHLRPLLYDLDLDVCIATALGLARLPDPQVVEILSEVTRSPHPPDRLTSAIILGLGWIGSKPAITSLVQMLVTATPGVGVASAYAEAEPLSGLHQQQKENRVREIIVSIGKTETDRGYASQQLVIYLQQGTLIDGELQHSAIVKQEIASTLGNLGNIDVVPDLMQLLGDSDDRVRLQTIATIAKLSSISSTPIIE
jgi:HEAT repeat protein